MELKCPNPECGADVPPGGLRGRTGLSGQGDRVALQGEREYGECPECGWRLVRNPDAPNPQWEHHQE
jgi:hypothetical protein